MEKPMRALVCSGGGSKGAFQVGALDYLMIDLKREYDIYCGVSVGAMNAAYLSQFPAGKLEGIRSLKQLWMNLETSDVYKRWCPFGKLHALWKKSVYNSKPVKTLIRKNIHPSWLQTSGNMLRIGAVSLKTGEYRVFTEKDPQIVKGVIASSALPGLLSPAKIDGELWVDGGIRNITPIGAAIDAGADEIDVIMCQNSDSPRGTKEDAKTIEIALKSVDIMLHEIMENDLRIAHLINEQVKNGNSDKRYIKFNIIRPTAGLTKDPLDFEKKKILTMIKQGHKDARAYSR